MKHFKKIRVELSQSTLRVLKLSSEQFRTASVKPVLKFAALPVAVTWVDRHLLSLAVALLRNCLSFPLQKVDVVTRPLQAANLYGKRCGLDY